MSPEDCSLCRAAGLHKKGPDLPPVPQGYQVTTKERDLRGKLDRISGIELPVGKRRS
jgi:hypothetical protein